MKGFSVIEVILATAMFMIFATGISSVVLQGFAGNRLGEEQTIANQYASEGLEAVRSIKNQAYINLVNSVGTGLLQSGGVWTFSGANNQFGPNNKYTRVITVADVRRDDSGNIVPSGGTLDPDSKKVASTVSWNAGPSRSDSVVLTTYLTDFRKSILALGGLIIYGDGTTTPKFRTYDKSANAFSSETGGPTGAIGRSFMLRTSPTKNEAIAGYVTDTGVLHVMCYNGSSWGEDWTVTVGGTANTRRFDIAYETNSGDALVLYGTNAAATNELAYRTKFGSTGCGAANWQASVNFDPARTLGTVGWVKMAWDKRPSSNLITAVWADSNSDLSAAVWSGSAWGNEPAQTTETSLEVVAASQDVDDFDVEYESSSGEVIVVWANSIGANGRNGVRYRTCTGGTPACTWSGITTPPTFSDDATNLDISANPNTDEIVFASIGNGGSDLQIGYWNGNAWTNTANADTSSTAPFAGSKKVATGWLISGGTSRSVIAYNDRNARNVDWYVGNGSVFTKQTAWNPTPLFATNPGWFDIQTDPVDKDQLILIVADSANDLSAKRLVLSGSTFTWSNPVGGGPLNASLPQNIASPYGFAYWRQ